MTTIENKYKDRSPDETIQIIDKFFNSLGLYIKQEAVLQSEANSWGCLLGVFSGNQKILTQNGKGTTRSFALASGYAELFERFCNKNVLFGHPIVSSIVLELNKENKGYYLHPEEKILSLEDFRENSPMLYDLYLKYCGDEENMELFFSYFFSNKIIGIPMTNCFDPADKVYEDPRMWMKMFNSGGLSAGNTLEEALVQAMSEIFERYACEQFFKNPQILCEVSKQHLNSFPSIANMLKNLPEHKTIKIFDLSYTYHVPACLGVLINNNNINYSLDFSGAPTFEIAAERVITELYQMRTKRADYVLNTRSLSPGYDWTPIVANSLGHVPRAKFFDINAILKAKTVNHFNTEYFLPSNNYSNADLLKHYQKISEQHGFGMYYLNTSPIENMYAVHVITHDKPFLTYKSEMQTKSEISTLQKKNDLQKTANYLQAFITALKTDNIENAGKIKKHLKNEFGYSNTEKFFVGQISGTDWFWPFLIRQDIPFIPKAAETPINIEMLFTTYDDIYRDIAKKYLMLYDFKSKGFYNNEDLSKFFETLGITFPQEDYDNILDADYFFYQAVIKTMKEMYSSTEFKKMIEAYNKIS